MTRRAARILVAAAAALVSAACAVPASTPTPAPITSAPATPPFTPSTPVDYAALDSQIESRIENGSVALDNVRAVVVVVDGRTKIAHYRHGFTRADHAHVFSVTKSVVSTLIGIAIGEGLISSLDAPLPELLPEHRAQMTPSVARLTLRDLLTMSGGFVADPPDDVALQMVDGKIDLVGWAVAHGQQSAAGVRFAYSDVSAHLAAAVLLDALRSNPGTRDRSVLDYARAKLFDPLGIVTRPAYQGIPVGTATAFDRSGFAWMRLGDLHLGGFGLRLTAEDMIKLGQLYLDDGLWHGTRILPVGWVAQATAPSAVNQGYGLFWWRDTQWGIAIYAAIGAGGQRIVVAPSRRAVIVVLSASDTGFDLDTALVDPIVDDVILRALQ